MFINDSHEDIKKHVDAIRASGILGMKGRLSSLFEYLVQTYDEQSPNEQVLAREVFGRGINSADRDDASVRVYIHRLRKKLEEFYGKTELDTEQRLVIPKGEYCLKIEFPLTQVGSADSLSKNKAIYIWLMVALLVTSNFAVWMLASSRHAELTTPSVNILWQQFNGSDKPIKILIGDYYMVGEFVDTPAGPYLNRLVRDFRINQSSDFEKWQKLRPQEFSAIKDIGLTYLPLSVAHALVQIVPLLQKNGREIEVLNISETNASVLIGSDIIYIGLVSGMGFLESVIFENAKYQPGIDYDELINSEKGKAYRTDEPFGRTVGFVYTDYAYLNYQRKGEDILLSIASLRDAGLQGLAEALANDSVDPHLNFFNLPSPVEALFSISGLQQSNIKAAEIVND